VKQNLKALAFGLAVALLLGELILRIYNPFVSHIRKGRIHLPASQQVVFHNKWISKLDPRIHYSRNALGMRGPLPTESIHQLVSVICMGGSTTECRFLSDDQTWPYHLQKKLDDSIPNIWINNAGLDGQSTFGHQLLLNEYIVSLRPRYILFLTGVNDVETDKPESFDLLLENKIQWEAPVPFFKSLLLKTELGTTAFQLYSIRIAYKKGLIHKEVDFKSLKDTLHTDQYEKEEMQKQIPYLQAYKTRIQQLIETCKQNSITPILITQASLHGNYTDPATDKNMGTKYSSSGNSIRNNQLQGKILESYNDVIRSMAPNTPVIDLASLMPKNSAFYYDFIHFNKHGAARVGEIIAEELLPILQKHR